MDPLLPAYLVFARGQIAEDIKNQRKPTPHLAASPPSGPPPSSLGADQLLPMLILAIVHARPARIFAQLQYIQR